MLIEPLQFTELYAHIRAQSANRGSSILVLVSNDSVDSLCALRILVNLLVTDQLQHSIRSVSNWTDIKREYSDCAANNPEVRSIILLNCGITTSLIEQLELYDPETETLKDVPHQFYIVDHHRPMDLENLWDQRDDPNAGKFALINILIYDQNETHGVNSDGTERYPTPDEPTEDDLDGEDIRRDTDQDDLLEYDEEGNPIRRPRRGWDADRFIELQNRRKKWTEQLTIHYDGSYFSIASSLIMAEMVEAMGKHDSNTIWLAIVGVTDMYLNQQMNAMIYNTLVADLRNKVRDQSIEDRHDDLDPQQRYGIKSGEIIETTELRLYLLRHWSVFESLSYTPYICSHVGIWRSEGQETIESILANMGLPLEQAKRLYYTMEPGMRHELMHTIPNTCSKPRYGLTDMTYTSFVKQYGNGYQVSAGDFVYALQAILESTDDTRVYNQRNTALEDGHQWEKNFSTAFDTLAIAGQQHNLKQGLELAKKMQKAIINEGNAMLIRKPFNYRDTIRIGVVESSSADIAILTQPLALRRLAEYVRDCIGGPIIKKNVQPTMIAAAEPQHISNSDKPTAPDKPTDKRWTHLVVGVQAVPVGLVKSKNRFGNLYRDAANKTGARIQHEAFDAATVGVQSDDFAAFREYVSLVTASDFEPDGELTG